MTVDYVLAMPVSKKNIVTSNQVFRRYKVHLDWYFSSSYKNECVILICFPPKFPHGKNHTIHTFYTLIMKKLSSSHCIDITRLAF